MENEIPTLYFPDRAGWRAWLNENFQTQKAIWFVFPLKAAGKAAVSYNDAVEEALCFGWIDSTVKALDATHKIQKFTPRNPASSYSQSNIQRLLWLRQQGLIHPAIREAADKVLRLKFVYPPDIIAALKSDPEVWKNYNRCSESYRRIRIAYIEDARKRPAVFKKRLDHFIAVTKKGKLITGYGGIAKYY